MHLMATTDECDLYLRISQDKAGLELGVDRQEAVCRVLCDRMGWTIRKVWKDNSKSATKGVRPEFEAMLMSKPKRIVMWSVDRLVRKGPDLERLIELDIPVHSEAAGPMDLATASGRLNARLLTSVATFEGEIKAERQRAAAAQRAERGLSWWPRRPFGLQFDGTLHPDEAPALAECYTLLLAGASLPSLAAHINDKGLTTNCGNSWTSSSLRPVLLNPRNAALRFYDGVEVGPAAWEAIVPEETYRQAARLLNSPERRTGGGGARQFLMSGLAVCDTCGGGIRVTYRGGKETGYSVYSCRKSHCGSHRTSWVDETVKQTILAVLSTPTASSVWAVHGEDAATIREDIVSLRHKMLEYEEDRDNDLMSRDSFIRMMTKARERMAVLEQALAEATGDSPVTALATSRNPEATWDGMDLATQRQVVEGLLSSVILHPRGRGVRESQSKHIDIVWRDRRGGQEEVA